MQLPLVKRAGIADAAVKVLAHPATATAATLATGIPVAVDMMHKKPAEEKDEPAKVSRFLPDLGGIRGSLAARAKVAGFVDAAANFVAKPAVQLGLTAWQVSNLAHESSANAAQPSPTTARRPTGPEGTQAQPSAFSTTQTEGPKQATAALNTPMGSVDVSQPVAPLAPAPSTRGNPSATAHSDGSSQGPSTTSANIASSPKLKAKPGAVAAFKGAGLKVAGLLESPKFNHYLNQASQAAVIGSTAIPAYQLWQEMRRRKEDEQVNPAVLRPQIAQPESIPEGRKVSIAHLLPLRKQAGMPIADRAGMAVRDFGQGAYDELDNQAGKLLQPSNRLDPVKTRTPSLLSKI